MLYQCNPTAFYQSEASLKPVGCNFNFGVKEPLYSIEFFTISYFGRSVKFYRYCFSIQGILIRIFSKIVPYFGMGIIGNAIHNRLLRVPVHIKEGNYFYDL